MPARFAQVDDNVFRGGKLIKGEIIILKDYWGINKIVSLDLAAGNEINKPCIDAGLEHIIIPLTTGRDQNILDIPEEIETWEKTGPIYIHCLHGRDRTSMVCAMYRIIKHNWTLQEALAEAHTFGMGVELDPFVGKSYYEAVINFHKHYTKDNNKSDDIVSIEREDKNAIVPVGNKYNDVSSAQQSFAPFTDVDVDHLNRPASRLDKLIKLANQTTIYKFCPMKDLLTINKLWYSTPEDAKSNENSKDAHLYSAIISNDSSIVKFNHPSDKTLVQSAMLNEADVALFIPTKEYYIINPKVLTSIHKLNTGDQNNITDGIEVGMQDNYTGTANLVFPGGGNGFMPGMGAGGMVELPSWNF